MEFFHAEPFGWEADCFRAGIVASTIANIHRDTKKKRTPFEAVDFIPGTRRQSKKIDGKALKAKMQLAFAGMAHADNLQNQGREGDGKSSKATRPNRGKAGGVKGSIGRGKAGRDRG